MAARSYRPGQREVLTLSMTICGAWSDLLSGLRRIDGWTITEDLPDLDEIGQMFIDYLEISEQPIGAFEAGGQPAKDLAEYRYRLSSTALAAEPPVNGSLN